MKVDMVTEIEIDMAIAAYAAEYDRAEGMYSSKAARRKCWRAALEAAEHTRGEVAKLNYWIDSLDYTPIGA